MIRFSICGYGYIGQKHAKLLSAFPGATLVAICDTQPIQNQWTPAQTYASLDEMLSSEAIDIVTIATPNNLHEQHAIMALNAGKHVLIEKPMALTKSGCEKIIYTALKQSKQVFCVMQNRYSPVSKWIKRLMEQKALGDIYLVQINCFWNRDDRYYTPGSWHGKKDIDGGVLFTQFSHFIDSLYWLFGDITNIRGQLHNFSHRHNTQFDDSGCLTFEFVDGGIGNLNFSTSVWDKNMESSMTIIAQKGSIKIGGQYMDKIEYAHFMHPISPDFSQAHDNDANYIQVLKNIVETLHGKTTIGTNALEGMKVVDIIERIYALG